MIALVAFVGIFGTLWLSTGGLTYLAVILTDRRPCPFRVVAGIVGGYVAGALFVWSLVPRDWKLPLFTTVAAAFDAETYGHPVEHVAEAILIWMLFAAVIGSVLGGYAAHFAGRRQWFRSFLPHSR